MSERQTEWEHVRVVEDELVNQLLNEYADTPEGHNFSDLHEYANAYRANLNPEQSSELCSYLFPDEYGVGQSHLVHISYDRNTHDKVRIQKQAISKTPINETDHYDNARRQLRVSLEALSDLSFIEDAEYTRGVPTDCTFYYHPEDHVRFLSLVELVFGQPAIHPVNRV